MKPQHLIGIGILAAGLHVGSVAPVLAQHPTDNMEFMFSNLRPTGQPVIPIFDGWYQKPDLTYDLCFGYFNLNTKESLDIPLGPDNVVEPRRFDGNQPTHFMPVPAPPNLYRRYFCTFAVNVPANFPKTERVSWTLRVRGRPYSVPGHLGSENYKIQELSAKEGGRSSVAPLIKFLPAGPEGRGRSGVNAAPLKTAVGNPLPLSLSVTGPPGIAGGTVMDLDDDDGGRPVIKDGKRRIWWVIWAKHQGPGDVTFSPKEIDVWEGETTVETKAAFTKPGEYVLRVQAIDNPAESASYQFHCCWTNGYVKVTVTP
jgi:hypothetical protein